MSRTKYSVKVTLVKATTFYSVSKPFYLRAAQTAFVKKCVAHYLVNIGYAFIRISKHTFLLHEKRKC